MHSLPRERELRIPEARSLVALPSSKGLMRLILRALVTENLTLHTRQYFWGAFDGHSEKLLTPV